MNGIVLKSNGTLQHISKILPGDYVVNMNGKPVQVVANKCIRNKRNTQLYSLCAPNGTALCHSNFGILTLMTTKTEQTFRKLGLSDTKEYHVQALTPSNINWDMPETFVHDFGSISLKPSYGLGFMLAAFLCLGTVNKYKGVVLDVSAQTNYVKAKLGEMGHRVFGSQPMSVCIEMNGVAHEELLFQNDNLADIMEMFMIGNSMDKKLPIMFHCKDAAYMKGLAEGLCHLKTETYIDPMAWTLPIIKKRFSVTVCDSEYLPFRLKITNTVYKEPTDVWDLQVACDTSSYVVNNIVVQKH